MVRKCSFTLTQVPKIKQNVTERGSQTVGGVSVDSAMDLTGFGCFNVRMLLFCGLLMLGMILETLGFSYILPAAACDLQLSRAAHGWVAAIPFVGFIVTSHAWGWLADARGRRFALALSTSVGAAFSVLSSFAPELYSFIVLRFCAALFISGGSALGYAVIGEFSPAPHRDRSVSLANASVALGTAVVPLVAWAVLPTELSWPYWGGRYTAWRLLVSCYALPYAICACAIKWVPESPKFLAARGRHDQALEVLKTIYSINTGRSKDEFKVTELVSSASAAVAAPSLVGMLRQSVAMFRPHYILHSLALCFLQFVSFATSNGFYMWTPVVVDRVWSGADSATQRPLPDSTDSTDLCALLASPPRDRATSGIARAERSAAAATACSGAALSTEAFAVTATVSACITVFTLLVALSLRALGKKPILFGIFAVAAAGSLAIRWTTHTVLSVLFFCSFQLCSAAIGLVNAFVVEIFPTQFRATAVCTAMLAGRLGSALFTKAIPSLLDSDCALCFYIASALLAASAAITLLLPSAPVAPTTPAARAHTGAP